VFDQETEIAPVVAEYRALLDRLANQWKAEGTVSSAYEELPFAQRLGRILTETGPAGYQAFDIALPTRGLTPTTPMHQGPAVFNLLTSPRLLDVVEQIVGPEILSNPIQHVRIKPPERYLDRSVANTNAARSDWHQDQGVALPEVDDVDILTVWIAVTDATIDNGCLCVVPVSHNEGLAVHCPATGPGRSSISIPDELIGDNVRPLPIRSGGVLLLHRRTKHASLSNLSNEVRWSFDLRYQPVGTPTGRPFHPSFVVRSRSNPDAALTDWQEWARLWQAAHANIRPEDLARPANRWDGSQPVCA
jgi:hypothetical protein